MSKGPFDMFLDTVFDADWKGRRGEKLTERELDSLNFWGRDGLVLRNVYVPKKDGETSEIDVLYITEKGIFVIESKNYSGWIFGDEKSKTWTTVLPNKMKNRFYNPIMQNRTHIRYLRKYINDDIPLFSIIAFSERCELKKVSVESPDIHVIKRDRLYATVRDIWDSSQSVVDQTKRNEIYQKIKVLTDVDEATKLAHIKNIKEKYKTPVVTQTQNAGEEMLCPRCGSKLVLRTAKKGANVGSKFYGCSNFPKCRYTQKA